MLVERWKLDEPSNMADVQTNVNQLQRDIEMINNGENGIRMLQTHLATLTQKVKRKGNRSCRL